MSWTFRLTINPAAMISKNIQPRDPLGHFLSGRIKKGAPELNQFSTLRFASKKEADEFAHKMFEPPLSVADWQIEQTDLPANFSYETKQALR